MMNNVINTPISREVLFEKFSHKSLFKEFFKDYFEGAEIVELDELHYLYSVFYVKNNQILIELEHSSSYGTYCVWINRDKCQILLKELNISYLQFKKGLGENIFIIILNNEKEHNFQIEHMENGYFETIEKRINRTIKSRHSKFSSFLKKLFRCK